MTIKQYHGRKASRKVGKADELRGMIGRLVRS